MEKKEYLRNKDILKDQIIQSVKQRRNDLFINKRKVPNRRMKFFAAFAFAIHSFGQAKLYEVKTYQDQKETELTDIQRKSIPFFQMLNDLDFIVLHKRKEAILESLFEGEKLEKIKKLEQGFVKPLDYWIPFKLRENPQHYGNLRDMRPTVYGHGYYADPKYDVFNI